VKVLIVSGFLGAGKTTFIRRMTGVVQDRRFAIFENEFGQTDIDAKVIGQGDAGLKVWEMTENCVCCTGKADFLTNLLTISAAVDPEILIVEPTGIARLGNILRNIEELHYDRIRVLPPVTIVDANAFFHEKEAYDETYLNQIEHSGTIVLSKSEQLSDADLEPYFRDLRGMNGNAQIVTGDYSKRPVEWWESFFENGRENAERGFSGSRAEEDSSGEVRPDGSADQIPLADPSVLKSRMKTVTFTDVRLPTPVHLMMILDLITGDCFGNIPRAKGCLPCGTPGEWIRFDLVDRQWMISGFPPQDRASATFIGPEIHEADLKKYFSVCYEKTKIRFSSRGGNMPD
jgi:G3E family GTPase